MAVQEHEGRDNTGGCVLLEVHLDGCMVRATTNRSRQSEQAKFDDGDFNPPGEGGREVHIPTPSLLPKIRRERG